MGNLSVVVRQLRTERERAQREVQRFDAALAALGGVSSNGSNRGRHSLSVSARRKISLAQKERWAKQKAKPSPHNVRRGPQENRCSSTRTLGQGEVAAEEGGSIEGDLLLHRHVVEGVIHLFPQIIRLPVGENLAGIEESLRIGFPDIHSCHRL